MGAMRTLQGPNPLLIVNHEPQTPAIQEPPQPPGVLLVLTKARPKADLEAMVEAMKTSLAALQAHQSPAPALEISSPPSPSPQPCTQKPVLPLLPVCHIEGAGRASVGGANGAKQVGQQVRPRRCVARVATAKATDRTVPQWPGPMAKVAR